MGWNEPGVPYDAIVEGKRMKFMPLSVADRRRLNEAIQELSDNAQDHALYELLAPHIVSIDGVGDDKAAIAEVLSVQSHEVVTKIMLTILRNASLSGAQEKNSGRSSGSSSSPASNGSDTGANTVSGAATTPNRCN